MAAVEQKAEPQVGLDQRLAAARHEAAQRLMEVHGLTARMKAAVGREQYDEASALQAQVPDAQTRYGEAAAQAKALELTLADVEQRRQEHEQQIAAEHRKVQARRILEESAARERALMDELQSTRAELVAGVGAIQETIERGYRLEQAVRQARSDANQAMVELGDRAPGMHIAAPNLLSSYVERTPALTAIRNGQALP